MAASIQSKNGYQPDKGAVDGWLPSAKRAHILTFPQLAPSVVFYFILFSCPRPWLRGSVCKRRGCFLYFPGDFPAQLNAG
jgi:hypothetical protein